MFIVQAVAPQCSSVERITYTLLRFVNLPRTVSVVFNVLFSLYSFSIEIDVIFVFRNNYYSQTVTMSHTKCLFTSHGSFLQKEKRKEKKYYPHFYSWKRHLVIYIDIGFFVNRGHKFDDLFN